MRATTRDTRTRGEAALASIYGWESPSPRRAKPDGEGEGEARGAGGAGGRSRVPEASPLPPLGRSASRLALCARVLPEESLEIPSTTAGGQHWRVSDTLALLARLRYAARR